MSSVLIALASTAIVALPISYYLCCSDGRRQQRQDGKNKKTTRIALCILWWIVFLSIPLYFQRKTYSYDNGEEEMMPLHSAATMILAVLSFMLPMKLMQLILFPHPPRGDKKTKKIKTNVKSDDKQDDQQSFGTHDKPPFLNMQAESNALIKA